MPRCALQFVGMEPDCGLCLGLVLQLLPMRLCLSVSYGVGEGRKSLAFATSLVVPHEARKRSAKKV